MIAVVLSYGSGGEYEGLLASLQVEGMAAERILVVHNPASPGEPDPALPPGCELMRASHNLGYAGGMNLGVARAQERGCELLLLLTHDARLRPGALAALLAAAERHPEYGVLGPALVLRGDRDAVLLWRRDPLQRRTAHRTDPPTGSRTESPPATGSTAARC